MSHRVNPGEAGLCAGCAHSRTTGNRRGSQFVLCRRSRQDRRYPKYPTLPVVRCDGFEEMQVSVNKEEAE